MSRMRLHKILDNMSKYLIMVLDGDTVFGKWQVEVSMVLLQQVRIQSNLTIVQKAYCPWNTLAELQ